MAGNAHAPSAGGIARPPTDVRVYTSVAELERDFGTDSRDYALARRVFESLNMPADDRPVSIEITESRRVR